MNYRVLDSTLGQIDRRGDGLNVNGERVRVSVHEAGHLVIAAALGAEPADAWIDLTGHGKWEQDGTVTRGGATYNGPTAPLFRLLVSLGGPLAEEHLHSEVRQWAQSPSNSDDSRRQAEELAELGGDAGGAIRARAEEIVRMLHTQLSGDLDELAFRLLQKNHMSRSDLSWFLLNARAYGATKGRAALTRALEPVTAQQRLAAAASTPAHTFAAPSPAFQRVYGRRGYETMMSRPPYETESFAGCGPDRVGRS